MIAVFADVYFFWGDVEKIIYSFIVLMVYFSLKIVPFFFNILNYGNGFYGI